MISCRTREECCRAAIQRGLAAGDLGVVGKIEKWMEKEI